MRFAVEVVEEGSVVEDGPIAAIFVDTDAVELSTSSYIVEAYCIPLICDR
jgi:hypothetical protein